MSQELPIVIEDPWEVYSYGTEDGPVFVTFFAGIDDIDQSAFPFCARVLIPVQKPNDVGGPDDAEADRIYDLEDQLIAALGRHQVRCLQVARLTHAGVRELVFQLRDWESFRPVVGGWMLNAKDYEIDVSEHEGWEFYQECVWPGDDDWQLIYDRHVVDGLLEAGSDPEKEHSLEFVFEGDQEALERVADELTARGYERCEWNTVESGGESGEDESGEPAVEPADDDDSSTARLVMTKRMPLDVFDIGEETLQNRRLAEQLEVVFDGWGAAVER